MNNNDLWTIESREVYPPDAARLPSPWKPVVTETPLSLIDALAFTEACMHDADVVNGLVNREYRFTSVMNHRRLVDQP